MTDCCATCNVGKQHETPIRQVVGSTLHATQTRQLTWRDAIATAIFCKRSQLCAQHFDFFLIVGLSSGIQSVRLHVPARTGGRKPDKDAATLRNTKCNQRQSPSLMQRSITPISSNTVTPARDLPACNCIVCSRSRRRTFRCHPYLSRPSWTVGDEPWRKVTSKCRWWRKLYTRGERCGAIGNIACSSIKLI